MSPLQTVSHLSSQLEDTLSKHSTAVQRLPLFAGIGAIAANIYLSRFVLPELMFVLGLAFLVLVLMNLWQDSRAKSALFIKFGFTLEAGGLLVYGARWRTEPVRHWLFDEGTISHIFIGLAIVFGVTLLVWGLLQGPLPHREVNPG